MLLEIDQRAQGLPPTCWKPDHDTNESLVLQFSIFVNYRAGRIRTSDVERQGPAVAAGALWLGQQNGALPEARQAYREAVSMGQAAGNIHLVIIANAHLASILIEQGELHQATSVCSGTLAMAERQDGKWSPLAGQLFQRTPLHHSEATLS